MNQSRREALKTLCLLPVVGILPAALPAVHISDAVIDITNQCTQNVLVYQQIQQICESLGIPYRVFTGE